MFDVQPSQNHILGAEIRGSALRLTYNLIKLCFYFFFIFFLRQTLPVSSDVSFNAPQKIQWTCAIFTLNYFLLLLRLLLLLLLSIDLGTHGP